MISLQVNGMSCAHCVKSVTEAVTRIDPAAKVAVSLPDKRVDVESVASEAALRTAIQDAGYEVPPAAH